jgi:transcriptional regulator with XRE-family HTH domain
MALLRRVLGDALRSRRLGQQRTLREVSTAANVSLGYLSEIERGHKEASSELLASICEALGARLSDVLRDVSDTMALAEQVNEVLTPPATPAVPAAADSTPAGGTITEGDLTVQVHYDGPLRATLRATRRVPVA